MRRPHGDQRTRRRIVDAATGLFAARGFKGVTIRAICRDARANVAAVNYHFGDKRGLYTEVIQSAAGLMLEATDAAKRAGEGQPPAGQLAAYIRVHAESIFAASEKPRKMSALQQLIHRELHDPTPGMPAIIERIFRPRFDYLRGVIAALLDAPPDDARVVRSALGIHSLVISFRPNVIFDRLRGKVPGAFDLEAVIAHVTAFSLAGLRAYRADVPVPPPVRSATVRPRRARASRSSVRRSISRTPGRSAPADPL
ncbi:MAG TPA: CerR family C-terminal domain-containing protein [Vicinamibacterales bacterium]|jgi:AcrR family transcriptional regulator|nr:CerR family C-terminal domain-containing protein [Vicinamibacterales bacterium]